MTAEHTPSREFVDALDDFTSTLEAHEAARNALRAAVAKELMEPPEPTNRQVAALLPWSEETVRGIAREYGVKPKRAPTVKSIKPTRRTKPTH